MLHVHIQQSLLLTLPNVYTTYRLIKRQARELTHQLWKNNGGLVQAGEMSSTTDELVEVSMVTEVVEESPKEDNTTSSEISSIEVAMETVGQDSIINIVQQKRSEFTGQSIGTTQIIILLFHAVWVWLSQNAWLVMEKQVLWRLWSMR